MSAPPSVAVVVPMWNEEADIAGCIGALGAQTYPLEAIELLLVDGGSIDATVAVAREAAAAHGFGRVEVLDNPRRRTSISLDVGLAGVRADHVVRDDARARVQPDYVERCVAALAEDPRRGVVGGAQVPRPRSSRIRDRAITRALRNRYAMGGARYRRAQQDGAADTVWMGSFRTADLRRLGGWNEQVALNEDWELNRRYRDAGQVVWFLADLQSGYLPRTSLPRLARQYFFFGRVKGMWWVRGMPPERRQLVLVAIPPLGLAALGVAWRRFGWRSLLAVPVGALVLDAVGTREPGRPSERAVAAVALGLITGGWWVGVVAGAAGELAGVEHQHRSAPE